jgi:HAD superfamily hydrolase (TIGR01490 family)
MIAAFFDFDGTLYDGHIWKDVVRHNWAAKRDRRWIAIYVVRNMVPYPLYKLGLLSQNSFYRTWGETMSWMLRGWTKDEGLALFEQLNDARIMPNMRADVLERMRQHQDQGHLMALVSGTFAPWLETIAQRLDVPHAIGTPMEVRNGRFTGRTIRPLCQGAGKPVRIKAYLAEHDLDVDWAASFAYGDSGPDLELLTQVGHPVAVYPDEVLSVHAQAEGWPVIGETSL